MSIFSAIRAGLSRIKSAVSSVGSRIKSAVTGGRKSTGSGSSRVSGEIPQQISEPITQQPTLDDLKAPTTQEIKDSHFRFKARHAGSDLSDYNEKDVDYFYAATRRIWQGSTREGRNDAIREYFESKYNMSDLEDIFEFVISGEVPDSDNMVQYGEAAYIYDYLGISL